VEHAALPARPRVAKRLGCRDYGRFDFRCAADGEPRLLEVNPNPAWANDGKLAFMAGFAGIAYPDMLKMILDAALRRADRQSWRSAEKLSDLLWQLVPDERIEDRDPTEAGTILHVLAQQKGAAGSSCRSYQEPIPKAVPALLRPLECHPECLGICSSCCENGPEVSDLRCCVMRRDNPFASCGMKELAQRLKCEHAIAAGRQNNDL
jgi:D-ala D-ala ligase C-terminus